MQNGSIETILSSQGSQQGDPAGGFLFCLGLRPALHRLKSRLAPFDPLIGAYFDDISIALPMRALPEAWQIATEELHSYSIEIVADKSKVFAPDASSHQISQLQPALPSSLEFVRGCTLLGTPLGDNLFIAEKLQQINSKLGLFLQ
jgi:hypothetical protein